MKLRVTGEHATDIRLWDTATYLLQIGTARKKGRFYPLLAASAFAFFAFEAYLNEVGRKLFPELWQRERRLFTRAPYRGTLGKFKYLAQRTGYRYSEVAAGPFATVCGLERVRDQLAHGRAELYDVPATSRNAETIRAAPELMKWGERSFAEKAVADVGVLADGLMAAAKVKYGEYAAGHRSSAFVGVIGSRSISLRD